MLRNSTERRFWIAAAVLQAAIFLSLSLGDNVVRFLRGNNLLRSTVLMALVGALVGVGVLLRRARVGLPTMVIGAILALVYAILLVRIERPEERLHLVQYGSVTALVFAAVRARFLPRRRLGMAFLVAAVLGSALGWLDEGVQYLLPDRVYELRDVLLNVEAAVLAAVSSWLLFASAGSDDPAASGVD